jgi:hypothetical protein
MSGYDDWKCTPPDEGKHHEDCENDDCEGECISRDDDYEDDRWTVDDADEAEARYFN